MGIAIFFFNDSSLHGVLSHLSNWVSEAECVEIRIGTQAPPTPEVTYLFVHSWSRNKEPELLLYPQEYYSY